MHEMSIAVSIMEIVEKEMEQHRSSCLKRIRLKIGDMTAVEPESLRFCFSAITEGTKMEGTVLDIEESPLTGRCSACREEFKLDRYFLTACPRCGEKAKELVSGRELDIVSMEVD